MLLWWTSIEPSNQRDWQTDVAVLPYATRDGDLVTLHNVRNFDYRTDQDFVPRYDDRTFDLRELDAVDLIAVYWMGDAIAHIMVSFGFAGEHVAFSIETRKEKGEAYSSIAGFFKRYELIYVVGDERDLIRVRTQLSSTGGAGLPLPHAHDPRQCAAPVPGVCRRINQLKDQPEFYNTLTTNCTTDVWSLARALRPPDPARLAGAAERLFSRVCLRPRQPRYAPAVCGAEGAKPDQRQGARRRRRPDSPDGSV